MKIIKNGKGFPYEYECDDCKHTSPPLLSNPNQLIAVLRDKNVDPETKMNIVRAVNSYGELLDALKTWREFWETMPKGQMGKLSFDVGLLNDGFVKMGRAIAKAEGK